MTPKTAVQNYIREKIPRLKGKDSGAPVGSGYIEYPNIELHHMLHALRLAGWSMTCEPKGDSLFVAKILKGNELKYQTNRIAFNFTDGQPASDEDWVKLAEVLEVKY